jgi:hypothetical protein
MESRPYRVRTKPIPTSASLSCCAARPDSRRKSGLRDLGPQFCRLLLGLSVEPLVFGEALDVSLGAKLIGGFEDPLFIEDAVDIGRRGHRCFLGYRGRRAVDDQPFVLGRESRKSASIWPRQFFLAKMYTEAVMNAKLLARLFAILTTAAVISPCGPIISFVGTGDTPGSVFSGTILGVSWIQTTTYTDVNISAAIVGSVTAYLTNAVGSGSNSGNVLAGPSVITPGPLTNPVVFTPLFSGLTLGPGTYYLLLTPDVDFTWAQAKAPVTFSLGAGVSDNGTVFAPASGFNSAFPPGSTFSSFATPANGTTFEYAVTAVPEPATASGVFLGIILIAFSVRFGNPHSRTL